MTQTKKKTLIVLIITTVLLLCFAVSMIGQSGGQASADTLDNTTAIKDAIGSIMANGKAPANRNNQGTAIGSESQLKSFLESGSGRGYLTQPISLSWDGAFTNKSTSENITELDGNGYTITLTASSLGSSPARKWGELDANGALSNSYVNTAKNVSSELDVYGGLIGYLRPNQTIRNCNFVFGQYIAATETSSGSLSTGNSGTLGLIAGVSLGTIENCSVTMKGSIAIEIFSSKKGVAFDSDSKESMANHSFAAGCFVGTMSTGGRISNSKIIHNGTVSIKRSGYMSGGTGWNNGHVRVWVGGIVGWMANSSKVYNVVTEGNGSLTADYGSGQGQITFSGIVAGIAGADTSAGVGSLAGSVSNVGTIDGVINNWTGTATYSSRAQDYSPNKVAATLDPYKENKYTESLQYLVVGLAGRKGESSSTVFNVFMNKNVYTGRNFSVGYDFIINAGRQYSTNILIQDVLGKNDGSTEYKDAGYEHSSLIFANTTESSPVWAVYDIEKEQCILWSKRIVNETTGATPTVEYYYDKVTSIEDAKKYDVTYTEISRSFGQNLKIQYAHGKAVYFNKSYAASADTTNPNKVIMPSIRYGAGLTAPKLNLFYNKEDLTNASAKPILTLSDKSYWISIRKSDNMRLRMSDDIVSPDTYESLLYIDSPLGKDYSYIQLINEDKRFVSYIYDDPNYQAYKATHPDYEPVRDGEKQIDWQQRTVQTVLPKIANIDWGKESDVTYIENSEERDLSGNIISYGKYWTTYDGSPVTFNISVLDLLKGDTCEATYEYRMLDNYTNQYNKVDSCVNAGTYKLVITGLDNRNYNIASSGDGDYCIDFEIKQREIGFINNLMNVEQIGDDTYFIKLTYRARDINLHEEIKVFSNKSQAENSDAKIVLYNILDKDEKTLKFDYVAHGSGVLDKCNVGMFEMHISLVSGINAGNYILPDITKYLVEIEQAEATLSTQTRFEYSYGFFVRDTVDPFVTATGVDDEQLEFGEWIYRKKGSDEILSGAPVNVGEYECTYVLLDEWYPNYKRMEVPIEINIVPRKVGVSFTDGQSDIIEQYGTHVSTAGIVFEPQTNTSGIMSWAHPYIVPKFRFYKYDESGKITDDYVEVAVDAGKYLIRVELAFTPATTQMGWQITEETAKNYDVTTDDRSVIIEQRVVNIVLNDVSRSYGDDLPQLNGEAYSTNRAWQYAKGSAEFNEEDNIILKPYLSDSEINAPVGKYKVEIKFDSTCMSDKEHWDNPNSEKYNKINNYIVLSADDDTYGTSAVYEIKPREVKVKVFLNTSSVIYGDDLPEFIEARIVGTNNFLDKDSITLTPVWYNGEETQVVVGTSVGNYFVKVVMDKDNEFSGNYKLICEDAEFTITPKTLTIISSEVKGESEYIFDGEAHTPIVIPEFAENIEDAEKNSIDFTYNYFEIVDGVTSTEATENPSYAGQYRVYIKGSSNPNYNIVFDESYERGHFVMTINKRDVHIDVLPAYRIYSVEGSLTPIMRGEINEDPNHHYLTKEEAEKEFGENFYRPYKYTGESATNEKMQFVQNKETLRATMYIDEYYKELGVKKSVVKLLFYGLVPDADALDEDGNWQTVESVGENGETILIIAPAYRNYNIHMNFGDLHILGAELSKVERYVSLKSYEQVYNGQDRFEDFRVLTSNDNIAKALKFSIFKYASISSLSKSEADALAKAYGKYTQAEADGKTVYERDDANGTYVRKFFRRQEYGDSVTDKIVDAGQYFMYIAPADSNAGIFEGYSDSISFSITKAEREVSPSDVTISVNYNKITVSSKIEGMEISFNGAGYVNRNTFADLTPDTPYTIKVRFAQTNNYLQSEDLVFNVRTGIDISAIKETLAKYDKIDFSNIDEYESKVLAFIGRVSQEDMKNIDQAKYAKLQTSYEQLLRGANSVVAGAQKVGALAVGKSGKTASVAKTVALSMSGVSVLLAGLMFAVKKKKDDEQEIVAQERVKVAKKVNAKRVSKAVVIVVAIALVCVMIFAGCTPKEEGFSKQDLYRIASYQSGGQSAGARDLTIEVKSSEKTLYKYADGKEQVVDKHLNVEDLKLDKDGIGIEFDDLHFANANFNIDGNTATFDADIVHILACLGVERASNGKISVVVDVAEERLQTLDVSYDIVMSGITYNVAIGVKVTY